MAISLRDMVESTAAFLADGLAGVTIAEAAALLSEADIDEQHSRRLRLLHRFLTRHPQALFNPVDSPSPVFVRLAQTLHRHGHTSVPLPACAGCGAYDRRFNRRDEPGRRCATLATGLRSVLAGAVGGSGRSDYVAGMVSLTCAPDATRDRYEIARCAGTHASRTAPPTGRCAATLASHDHLDDAWSVDSRCQCRQTGPSVRSAFRARHALARTRPPAGPATIAGR
ncbi:hypothetical protein GCM10029963_72820 [Micromonospora andamanensis]|nr:hypothetical protein Vwe01_30450 [Micromonospora andamanensis]